MKYFCQNLGVYVFIGYICLGDSFFFNLNFLLIGLILDSILLVLFVYKLFFIFKNFFEYGVVNVFVEDWYKVVIFKGFID